ncbi:MAG: Cna B-type domain-containing protein, partial [Eubacteriales bacterium]|nr:Cna B-type domain-containing protein [Eubacteriales bacterium]
MLYDRISTSRSITHKMFVLLIVLAMLITGLPQMSLADSGAYSIKFYASDPALNKGPYSPTYEKMSPFELAPYASGRGNSVLEDAVLYGPTAATKDGVTSLEPSDLALGQIVVFQIEINVGGSVLPEDGKINFKAGWRTKTTNGSDFGFDPSYGVYSAFVDAGDVGSVDPGEDATVQSVNSSTQNSGTSTETIVGDFVISGLDDGDNIIVEVWMVLKDRLPSGGATGNVHTEIIEAATAPASGAPQTISTGNQTVPLKQVGSFTSTEADISVVKSDLPDPVYAGDLLTYSISVTNNSTKFVANGVQVMDLLDPNLDFVSADNGGVFDGIAFVNWPQMALSPLETVTFTITAMVRYSTADVWSGLTADDRGGRQAPETGGLPDLLNMVTIASVISVDPDPLNNIWFEPTNVLKRTTDIVVTKTWNDSYDDQENYFGLRPTSIMAQLLQNGQPYGSMFEINAAAGWSKTITNLPLNDEGGSPYTYTVKEESDNSAYNTSEDGLIIVNSLRRTEVEVVKQWDDFDDTYGYRPDTVLVELLQNGVPTGIRETLSEQNNWRHTFAGLPERDNNGQLFVYTVTELDVPDRYVSTVGEDGLTITNTLKTGEITVNKLAGTATNLTDEVFFVKLVKADDTSKFWIKQFTVSSPAVFDDLPFGTYNISEVADASGTPISSLFEYYVNVHDSQLTINDQNPELATD